jgi:hypothetical protein
VIEAAMFKKTDPKPKSKKAPAEKRSGNVQQRNKDDRTAPRDDGTNGD